jgi:hypothetical protein
MIGDTPLGLILAWIGLAASLGFLLVLAFTPSMSIG